MLVAHRTRITKSFTWFWTSPPESTIIRCSKSAHPGIVLTQTDRLVMKSCLVVAADAAGVIFASLRTTISALHLDLPSWNDSRYS
jgi:hypothetical protein